MTTSCSIIIIENFYENPLEVRNFALKQNYKKDLYYPGNRTKSFANDEIKNKLENIIKPFAGNIVYFSNDNDNDNGTFQYATSYDHTWIHKDNDKDNDINWTGIVYLTPDAPFSSGTTIYKYKNQLASKTELEKFSKDYSKWDIVDNIGNVFNRLLIFDSTQYHASTNYFGTDIYNSRLFQVFFFKTEHINTFP
jgi:hypothetical protein